MKHHFSILLFAATASFVLTACESDVEKAERLRLEELYAADNAAIAEAAHRDYGDAMKDVRAECEKERMKKQEGKWCAKSKEVRRLFWSERPAPTFSRPKW